MTSPSAPRWVTLATEKGLVHATPSLEQARTLYVAMTRATRELLVLGETAPQP